jgi:energy-coupling factor transporter ATP-binding protein EcfA2
MWYPSSSDTSIDGIDSIDAIDVDVEHFERNELVEKLQSFISENLFVVVSSPAASGKSSLFKLYQAANPDVKVLEISFADERTPYGYLLILFS